MAAAAEPEFPPVLQNIGAEVWGKVSVSLSAEPSDEEATIWRDVTTASAFLREAVSKAASDPDSVLHWLLVRVAVGLFEERFVPLARSAISEVSARHLITSVASRFIRTLCANVISD